MRQFETTLNETDLGMLEDSIFDAKKAHLDLDCPVRSTDIFYSEHISNRLGTNVWLASEVHQTTGAYKIRGAYNRIRKLDTTEQDRGIVTASAGNHAQGVALCARAVGVAATVFMPKNTPDSKIDAVRGNKAQVILKGRTFDDSYDFAREYNKQKGATFIHPFDDELVIAGQGTLGVEIGESLEDIDAVFCPVGGGGLLSGIGTAIRSYFPEVELYGVEPDGAASLALAMDLGRVESLSSIDTYVDGASVRRIGRLPFNYLSELDVFAVAVSNDLTRKAVTDLWENRDHPIRAERAGALALAGAMQQSESIKDKNVLLVVSGGNLSPEDYNEHVRMVG